MRLFLKSILILSATIITIIILAIIAFFLVPGDKPRETVFGVAFSKIQAERLGLNWQEAFIALLDDLKIKNFRLASYWSETEPQNNKFHWENLDWQINEINQRNGKIVLVLGRKQFRWPECFIPDWANAISLEEQREEVLQFIEETVNRYKGEKNIWAWQVENEPLFPFGICPERNAKFLDKEIERVKELDSSRPVIITDSGEMSLWIKTAKRSDIFGTTLYRIVKNRVIPGYLSYEFVPASFYHKKAAIIKWMFSDLQEIIIIELQAEPWGMLELDPLEQQFQTVNFERFKRNIQYAQEVGYKETYLWGAEWWYWMKIKKEHPEFWEYVRTLRFE